MAASESLNTSFEASYPAGPRGLPGVGNLFAFRRDPLSFVRGVHRTYGSAATVLMMGRKAVFFFRPEHAQFFLVDHARGFASGTGRDVLKRFLGEALLTTDGDVHRRQRRLVQPAFHKKRVETYAEIMTGHTRDMLDTWRAGEERDLTREFQELTLRIVVKALFDVDLQTQSHVLSGLFSRVIENQTPGPVASLPIDLLDLPFMPTHKAFQARRELDSFVYELIAQRRAAAEDTGDVLSMLLSARDEVGAGMSDLQVRDQTMTLIAAGHETTSNALSWTFHLLAHNPEKYARLLAEVDRELGGRTPTVEDLPRLRYLDWVVTESLRYYPPAWTLNRTALKPFELDGYRIPAGTRCLVSQWVIHHLPEVWGDPEAFRPERWDPANGEEIPRGAYFPFGAGPRICIGMPLAEMEMRLVLATILQRFAPREVAGWPVEPLPRVTLRLKHGLRARLEARAGGVDAASVGVREPVADAAPVE
jgi:cytochrome P450